MFSPSGQVEVEQRVVALSAEIAAKTAELVRLCVVLDDDGSWYGLGLLSCAHWLTVKTGVHVPTGRELIRVGHALERLPHLAAAFADGRLSFDQMRELTRVATPEDEEVWLELGLTTRGPQLSRICAAVRRAVDADGAPQAERELATRALHAWWRDDGMLELKAVLPREDGAALMAAVEAVALSIADEQSLAAATAAPASATPDPCEPKITRPQLRADALVRVCEDWIAHGSQEPALAPTRQVVVHIDSRVLTDGDSSVRSHLEDGPWLSPKAAEWLSCDADVVAILERDGTAVDVGYTKRLITPRLRLAMYARDQGCRYPGCGTPARRTEGHHVRHWPHGGTDLENLISLCRFHHRRHHHGAFVVHPLPNGDFRFEAPDGTPLVPAESHPRAGPAPLNFGRAMRAIAHAHAAST